VRPRQTSFDFAKCSGFCVENEPQLLGVEREYGEMSLGRGS